MTVKTKTPAAMDAVLRGLRESGLQPVVLYDLSGAGEVVIVGVANKDPDEVPVPQPAPGPAGWAQLSERERAVALLVGRALTNRQIGRQLGISPHTVNYHLRQIFRKLAISSRVSLAAYIDAPRDGGYRSAS